MKLATKLVTIFMLFIALVITVDGWWSVREETKHLERLQRREIVRIAVTLRMTAFTGTNSHARVVEFIDRINADTRQMPCRWVWLGGDSGPTPAARVSLREIVDAESGILYPVRHETLGHRLGYVRVAVEGERPGGLEVVADADGFDELERSQLIQTLRVAAVLLLLSGVSGVFFGHRLVAVPLQQLIDKTRRIGRGDLADPVAIRGHDELSELGAALNGVCDDLAESRDRAAEEEARRIDAVEQLRHADRLRTVGQLAAGIAHELGTPLGIVSGRADMIAGGRLADEDVAESARIIKGQSERISTIVRQVLDFARAGTPDKAIVDVRTLIEQTRQLLAPAAGRAGVALTVDAPGHQVLAGVDAAQVQQVMMNLVVNAIHASPRGASIELRVSSVTARPPDAPDAGERSFVRIDVEDAGPGIPADILDQVFDPFFTTKGVGEGTGMGLAVAYGIVREHHGWIAVDSVEGRGTRFSVHLPAEIDP